MLGSRGPSVFQVSRRTALGPLTIARPSRRYDRKPRRQLHLPDNLGSTLQQAARKDIVSDRGKVKGTLAAIHPTGRRRLSFREVVDCGQPAVYRQFGDSLLFVDGTLFDVGLFLGRTNLALSHLLGLNGDLDSAQEEELRRYAEEHFAA